MSALIQKIIEAVKLSHRYVRHDEEGNVIEEAVALDGVSFQVQEGQFIAVLGHNGSGKSTLAKHINALLQPDGGTILIDGMDTKDAARILDIRRTAGMVFQNPDNQIIGQIVEEDVAFGPENLGVPTPEILTRVEESLRRVDMLHKRKSSPNKLSGGQKQRVSIAGVLAMKPKVLILDEPTAMLDPRGRAEVLSAAHDLNRREGITVLFITHDMEEAVDADRVIVMDKGHIALDGTPAEVFAQADKLREMGLQIPFSLQMAEYLREQGVRVQGNPLTLLALCDGIMKGTTDAAHI